jgi:hypothetical protein
MNPQVKKQLKSLSKLRSCARPNSAKDFRANDLEWLKENCQANIHVWGEVLEHVDLATLPAPHHPAAPDIKERLKKLLKKYMDHEERDTRHVELKTILREAHQELGGAAAGPPPPPAPAGEEPPLHAAHLAARTATRDRLIYPLGHSLYPENWLQNPDEALAGNWDPMNWNAEDLKAISEALDRRELTLGARQAPDSAGGLWPSLSDSNYQVNPACSKYKKKEDCIWPCAFKAGNADKTRMCRPARKT